MTASSVSIFPMSRSTDRYTRPPTAAKEQAAALWIAPNWAGNGLSQSTRLASPIGWAIDGANRNDVKLLEPTLDAVAATGLLADIDTVCLDRSYDYPKIRRQLNAYGLDDLDIQKRGTKPKPGEPHRLTLGLRWIVEATNSWWSNYGQLRRSTDRTNRHRHAALRLATTVLIIGRLIDHRNRWNPESAPTG